MTDKEKDFDATDFTYKFGKMMFEGEKRPPHPDKTDLEAIKKVMKSMLREERKQRFIDETNSLDSLLLLVEKYDLFDLLEKIEHLLSQSDLSTTLKDIWTYVECANYDNPLSVEALVGIFRSCNPEVLMGEDDYRYYQELPDELTVYRGTIDNDEDNIKSMSWTLNKDVAIWFAKRFRGILGDGFAYKAKINKAYVLAYFSNRNESTVVVNPFGLHDIEEIESA